MARGRPCGRSKSDHRDCQAIRFARAADYRERIYISAEKQAVLIAAVNARCHTEPAPRRRRGRRFKKKEKTEKPTGEVPRRQSFTAAEQTAKRHDAKVLKDAVKCGAYRDFKPARGVFCSSAPKCRALIEVLLQIGAVESNPGPSGRPLILLPTAKEVEENAKPKPVGTEYFDAWRANEPGPSSSAPHSANAAAEPALDPGPSFSAPHPASIPRPAAAEPPRDPAPPSNALHPAGAPRPAAMEPEPAEISRRKRTAPSREGFPGPSNARIRVGSPDGAEASDQEVASVDIEETSEEAESEEEATSEDLRGIDDSSQPDPERRDLYRQKEMEEVAAQAAAEEIMDRDEALAPMRREMQRRRAPEALSSPVSSMMREDLVAVPEPAVRSDPLTGNEVFKKDNFRVLRLREHGTNSFHQRGSNPRGRLPGPKFFMQQEAALLNHEAQVVMHKWSGIESNGGTEAGAEAGHEEGERYTREEVMRVIEEWAGTVFSDCYGHELEKSSFVWIESSGQTKFSLHLTINQLAPRQLVFGSNTEGALHFATRLKKRLHLWHPAIAALIDLNVYTKDREWRTPGSAKVEKPQSVLTCMNPAHSWKDALVTWLEPQEAREEVKLPFKVPDRLHEGFRNPRVMSERGTERSSQNSEFVKARMLALLRERLHPTACEEGEDRYNYSDRTEPCYTGRIHENRQNLRCFLNPNGKIYALCYSQNTEGGDSEDPCVSTAFCLGDLYEDDNSYESGAVQVDLEHLRRVPDASTPRLVSEVAAGVRSADDVMKLNAVTNEWVAGTFPLLGIRSGVNTGKTVFCGAVGDELWRASDRPMTTIMITYRVAQAQDLKLRFPRTVNYLDLKADHADEWFSDPRDVRVLLTALQCREKFPEVVVQVDSLLHLRPEGIGEVAPFDLVILDEVASILAHLSAATLRNGIETSELLLEIVRRGKRVLAMDDGYGQREHDFFQLANVPGKLIINTRRAAVPLTFLVCQDEEKWLARIVADLEAGKNVVVVSMSARVLDRIRDRVTKHRGLGLADGDILIHKALSGGDNTALLRNVAVNWKVRLLMYSPTVEAGVNFDEDWFHTKFLYMCMKSTTARAAWQATLRVRRTESSVVHCFVQSSISVLLYSTPLIPASRLHTSEDQGMMATTPEALDADDDDEPDPQEPGLDRLDQQVAVDSVLDDASLPRGGEGASRGGSSKRAKGLFAPPRRVTTAETSQYLQVCNNRATAAWRREWTQTEDRARVVRLIEDGPLFRAFAHTEAERQNSNARLLHEFQLQVARAGHVVEIEQVEELAKKKRRPKGLDPDAVRIIEARAIDGAEYERVKRLVHVKRDSGSQHLEVMRYEACQYYGLKDIDEHFLRETKAHYKAPFSEQLDFLLKVLLPGKFLDEGAVARKSHEVVMVQTARNLLTGVMGLAHAFDVGGEARSLLAGGLKDRLERSDLFEGHRKRGGGKVAMRERPVSQLFGIQLPKVREGKDDLEPRQWKAVMDGVLKRMGLKLGKAIEVSRPRRGKGKEHESGAGNSDYKWKLEAKNVLRMATLVKLQVREVPRVWQHRRELAPAVREFLNEVDASGLDYLLRRPSGDPPLEDLGPPAGYGWTAPSSSPSIQCVIRVYQETMSFFLKKQ
ncbi:hypothetical protein KFL_010140010 [Klebsormidium nitens]|uniref:Replication origin-binding protein domain-containing protein n=1 Tax=Klebsormidium nitens TaxID=105231 RepID=A0A1Y1IT11_KLENI|nr:hypothetical protein KFL_010140010 [Klebsormidium nitens]|eukprot:GAQ92441.1 hypothetical protein KFL_010140010 [Klebsormidium nitens]